MNEGKRILVRTWLEKARSDLRSAKILAGADDPPLDTAVYHCQQATEKAVKGFLTFHDCRFEKTHDVAALVDLAKAAEPSFSDWIVPAQLLTPYVHMFRYPDEMAEPTQEEFDRAIQLAENLYSFVLSALPEEVHPRIG